MEKNSVRSIEDCNMKVSYHRKGKRRTFPAFSVAIFSVAQGPCASAVSSSILILRYQYFLMM